MEKLLSTIITISLISTTPGILIAEENIQLSDDYFEIKASEDNTSLIQLKNKIAMGENEGLLSIEPSPDWNIQRDRENELIEETSFNESSFDGIITQNGIELAKNTPDVTKSGNQKVLNHDAKGDSSSSQSEDINRVTEENNALPKTLKVRPESHPDDEEPIVESSLGDWVFDFPK
jgi:hypothetical protein